MTRTNVPEFSPLAQQSFDEYTIVGKLGHGGMAEVLLAISEGVSGFRKLVVVKRLHDYMNDEEAVVQMFLDEAKLASRLNHANVVQTLKVGVANQRYFLAMEYLEGQPLNRVLRWGARRKKLLPVPLAARVMTDTLDGLHYAHQAKDYDGTALKIIHRDVSPHNIFITYEGTVKILDFGIAKAATQEARTGTGLVKGKFGYMAPEQARADEIDARADVWSAGVVMWEMLTGYRLFKGNTDAATLQMTMTAEIPPVSKHRPEVPAALENIVKKALSRDLDERYQNALSMKEEIDDWLATRTRSSSRNSLTNYMHDIFGEQIEETRVMIKNAVEREGGQNQKLFGTMAGAPGTSGTGSYAAVSGDSMMGGGTPSSVSAVVPAEGQGSSGTVTVLVGEEQQRAQRSLRLAVGALFAISAVTIGLLIFLLTRQGSQQVVQMPAPAASEGTVPATDAEPSPSAGAAEDAATGADADPSAAPSASASATEQTTDDGAKAPPTSKATSAYWQRRAAAAARKKQQKKEAEEKAAQKKEAEPQAVEYGFLSVNTTPWSNVTAGGRALGATPVMGVRLPVGTHTVTVRNPELGITRSFVVSIKAGKTTTRHLGIQ